MSARLPLGSAPPKESEHSATRLFVYPHEGAYSAATVGSSRVDARTSQRLLWEGTPAHEHMRRCRAAIQARRLGDSAAASSAARASGAGQLPVHLAAASTGAAAAATGGDDIALLPSGHVSVASVLALVHLEAADTRAMLARNDAVRWAQRRAKAVVARAAINAARAASDSESGGATASKRGRGLQQEVAPEAAHPPGTALGVVNDSADAAAGSTVAASAAAAPTHHPPRDRVSDVPLLNGGITMTEGDYARFCRASGSTTRPSTGGWTCCTRACWPRATTGRAWWS